MHTDTFEINTKKKKKMFKNVSGGLNLKKRVVFGARNCDAVVYHIKSFCN